MKGGAGSHLRRPGVIIGALVAGVLLLALLGECQRDRWDAERDALILESDSLRIETRKDSAMAAVLILAANRESQLRATAEDRAQRAIAEADRLRALRRTVQPVASQPGSAPTVADALVAVDSSLTLCEEETDSLRSRIVADSTRLASMQRDSANVRAAFTIESTAASQLRVTNADLTRLLASADPPCRIAFWRCPSRTTLLVTGVILGAGTTYKVTRR